MSVLGDKPAAVVVDIGVILIRTDGPMPSDLDLNRLMSHTRICVDSQLALGRQISDDTLAQWSGDARALERNPDEELVPADLTRWWRKAMSPLGLAGMLLADRLRFSLLPDSGTIDQWISLHRQSGSWMPEGIKHAGLVDELSTVAPQGLGGLGLPKSASLQRRLKLAATHILSCEDIARKQRSGTG